MKAFAPLCLCLLLYALTGKAQDSVLLVGKITYRYADKVEKKMINVEEKLSKQGEKALKRLHKQNQKAYKALYKLDSGAAKTFLFHSQQQYTATLSRLKSSTDSKNKKIQSYTPGLDSAGSVLKYLGKLAPADKLPDKEKLATALAATAGAGHALDDAIEVKKLILQQEAQLKALATHYKDLDVAKQLKACNKELYYYSQRLQQAKQTLNDPEKIEREVLKLLRKNEGFKSWMQQNGQLAGLFGNTTGTATTAPSLAGLQTRQSVQQLVQSRLGGTAQQAQQLVTGAVQGAQGQLNNVRSRLQQLGNSSMGGAGSTTLSNFKPNTQKTKPFLKRFEKGWNLQATQRNGVFPSVNEMGTNLGYKLNDKSVIGIGAAYRFGLGERINKIRWTNEGISFRSYIDLKWKGNWWISGGYEQTYWSRFRISDLNQLKALAWQKSGLVGLTKKIAISKKKEMKAQILYDLLQKNRDNKSFPFIIRTGVNF